jgi:hypothetical protein
MIKSESIPKIDVNEANMFCLPIQEYRENRVVCQVKAKKSGPVEDPAMRGGPGF